MGLPIHLSEVPDFEPRGDCIRIIWRDVEVFVPIPIVLASMGRCKRSVEEWGRRNADVIPIRIDVAAE